MSYSSFSRRPAISGAQAISALVGGLIGLSLTVCLRLSVGSPWAYLYRLTADSHLPPLWVLSLAFVAAYCLVGATLGLLLASAHRLPPLAAAAVWRGTACLIFAVMLLCLWYALLFGSGSLLLSLLCLPVAAAAALLAGISWFRPALWASLVPIGLCLFLLCLCFWQGSVILHH